LSFTSRIPLTCPCERKSRIQISYGVTAPLVRSTSTCVISAYHSYWNIAESGGKHHKAQPITTNVVGSIPSYGEAYSSQQYVIKWNRMENRIVWLLNTILNSINKNQTQIRYGIRQGHLNNRYVLRLLVYKICTPFWHKILHSHLKIKIFMTYCFIY
jgi:hypothetical protein